MAHFFLADGTTPSVRQHQLARLADDYRIAEEAYRAGLTAWCNRSDGPFAQERWSVGIGEVDRLWAAANDAKKALLRFIETGLDGYPINGVRPPAN